MTASAVRADPSAAPASAAADSCLTQPNGPAPAGRHWYYRIERASGRHCWHVGVQIGGNADRKIGQGERAETRSVSAPASRPATPPDPLPDSGDNGPSAAAPVLAPPSPRADWPTATSQVAAPFPSLPAATGSAEAPPPTALDPTPAADAPPAADANQHATDASPPAPAPIVAQAPPTARPATSAVDPAHVPALLGTALVLAFIILASIAARLAGRFLRRQPNPRTLSEVSPNWDALGTPAPDITALPVVRRRDRAKEPEPPEGMRVADPARETRHTLDREIPQGLENNVRELLHRVRRDVNAKPPGVDDRAASTEIEPNVPMASTNSPPAAPVSADLEAALAVWSGKNALTRQ